MANLSKLSIIIFEEKKIVPGQIAHCDSMILDFLFANTFSV